MSDKLNKKKTLKGLVFLIVDDYFLTEFLIIRSYKIDYINSFAQAAG